jgi:hypothetical protein
MRFDESERRTIKELERAVEQAPLTKMTAWILIVGGGIGGIGSAAEGSFYAAIICFMISGMGLVVRGELLRAKRYHGILSKCLNETSNQGKSSEAKHQI